MDTTLKYYVAGHRGMVGSAIVRALGERGCHKLVTATSADLDLRNQESVRAFIAAENRM